MPSFNKVILAGNLTRDVELRYTPKGTAVAEFGMAINRKWKTDDGEEREEVCFVDLTTFGRRAETVSQYVRNGNPLLIEGYLKLEQWDDKQTGQKRSKIKVMVENFTFLGTGDGHARGQAGERPARRQPEERATRDAGDDTQRDDDESVPF